MSGVISSWDVDPDYRFREGDHIILIGRSNEVFKLAAKM